MRGAGVALDRRPGRAAAQRRPGGRAVPRLAAAAAQLLAVLPVSGKRGLHAAEVLYTRRVTAAWAVFFFAITALSLVLYRWAPLRIWSIYINFCVLPLIAAMFLAEYLVRRQVLPQVTGAGLLATVRVYIASQQ
jgi:uncharacterized membrane protein